MKITSRFFVATLATVVAMAVLIAGWRGALSLADAEVQAKDIGPNELIEKITVKIEIGAGADLDEPVALDLGLGYLLWLQPVGRQAAEAPPPGAFPQESTAKEKIAAGDSATFTFRTKGDAGLDKFRTSQQLLANTRLGDIARVGFASKGTGNWVLAGYDIQINDKPFASGKPNVNAGDRDTAAKRLADLAGEIGPLEQAQSDLLQLYQANQLEKKDKAQLDQVLAKLRPLMREKTWLEGQLEGKYPWFEDKDYMAPAAGKPLVRSAKVTLLTFTHTGADTENYVYVRVGGRKYFVSSPDQPLTGQAGPQAFGLDLLAGPLTDGDLRDWAVGMMGNAKPHDIAPDRWHGQRIAIEIDGQVLYDSDKKTADRLSLGAVRLIPPAHLDKDGTLVLDKETKLQFYLWDPTKGLGLDPKTGRPLPPPPPDDPGYPPEPGPPELPIPSPEPTPPGVPPIDGPPILLPGEQPIIVIVNPIIVNPNAGDPPWGVSPILGGPPWGGGPILVGLPWGMGPIPGGPPIVIVNPPPIAPTPSGTPPQVHKVRFISGWKVSDHFTVKWDVAGDENQVDHYLIEAKAVDPTKPWPFVAKFKMGKAGRGHRSFSAAPDALATAAPAPRFLAATVTAVPVAVSPWSASAEIGPARMVFPAATSPNPFTQPMIGDYKNPFITAPFRFGLQPSFGAPISLQPITVAEQPITTPSVWPQQGYLSSRGVHFEAAWRGLHLGVRPAQLGSTIQVNLICLNPTAGAKPGSRPGLSREWCRGSVTAQITQLQWYKKSAAIGSPATQV